MTDPSAAAHTEIELKLVLEDELSYARLRAWLDTHGQSREAVQRNRYLDTADRALLARQVMVRVRVTPHRVVCTGKAGAQLVDGLMQVQEWQADLEPAQAAAWRAGRSSVALGALPIAEGLLAGPLADLADAAARQLHVIGVMQTTRRAVAVPPSALGLPAGPPLMLELDRSLFPAGPERFELEVEHADAAALRRAITELLDGLGVQWRPAAQSKYAQFLACVEAEDYGVDEMV